MKKAFASAFISACILLLAGSCGSQYLETAKIADQLGKSYDYDGKNVELHGNLESELLVFGGTEDRSGIDMSLKTTRTSNGEGGYISSIKLNYGKNKPNSVFIDVPEGNDEFTMKDVTLYDKDGKEISCADVKVKGTVRYMAKGQKKEQKNAGGVDVSSYKPDAEQNDYSYIIENVTIEKG